MTEPDPTTAPDAQSVGGELPASTEPRRQLFRRRPAESQLVAAPPDGSAENTLIMAAPQPTEIISAEQSAQAAADESPKKLFRRRPEASAPAVATPPETGDGSSPEPGSRGALERERRTLVDEREGHVYHLGGLAFELHRRGLLPDGVMRLRAGNVEQTDDRIREIDASLDAIEAEREERRRVEKERRAASAPGTAPEPAGVCSSCATAFQSEARFCWSCGTPVSITRAAAEPAAPTVDTP